MMKQRWGLDRNVLRTIPGDPWSVEQHHWNTGAKENQQSIYVLTQYSITGCSKTMLLLLFLFIIIVVFVRCMYRDVAYLIICHEQNQLNRVCCFQTLHALFQKDLFSDLYLDSPVSVCRERTALLAFLSCCVIHVLDSFLCVCVLSRLKSWAECGIRSYLFLFITFHLLWFQIFILNIIIWPFFLQCEREILLYAILYQYFPEILAWLFLLHAWGSILHGSPGQNADVNKLHQRKVSSMLGWWTKFSY